MRRFGRWLLLSFAAPSMFAETIPTTVPLAGERARAVSAADSVAPAPPDELSRDPHVREMMALLWKAASLGTTCWERAAWIVRNDDGSYSCVQVPPTRECFQLKISTERPDGAVALVHTHPSTLGVSRRDEGGDVLAAEKIGLPLYTIGRGGLLKYDPETNVNGEIEFALNWLNGSAKDRCNCEIQSGEQIRMAKIRANSARTIEAARTAP